MARQDELFVVSDADMFDEFHQEIKRLTEEVEYYKTRYEMILQIHDTQVETIKTYHTIMRILDAELKKLRGEEDDKSR